MRVVYYILPRFIGESVIVSDGVITRESEIALIVDHEDRGKPFFDLTCEDGHVDVTNSRFAEDQEPLPQLVITANGYEATIPANSAVEASWFGKFLYERINALEQIQDQ